MVGIWILIQFTKKKQICTILAQPRVYTMRSYCSLNLCWLLCPSVSHCHPPPTPDFCRGTMLTLELLFAWCHLLILHHVYCLLGFILLLLLVHFQLVLLCDFVCHWFLLVLTFYLAYWNSIGQGVMTYLLSPSNKI